MSKKVLICGQRSYDNDFLMELIMSPLNTEDTVIQGEAKGADLMAKDIALDHEIRVKSFPAKWDLYGKAAGPIRNKQMLEEGKPDEVWAFFTSTEEAKNSKGTKHMISIAEKAGIPVYKYYGGI